MEKSKYYHFVRFSADTIRAAIELLEAKLEEAERPVQLLDLTVYLDDAAWKHDALSEFWADYRRSRSNTFSQSSTLEVAGSGPVGQRHNLKVQSGFNGNSTRVSVRAPDRGSIEDVFEVFELGLATARRIVPAPNPKPTVFIGHGHSGQWRDLRDHLRDHQGMQTEAFESGARAGHAVRDILEDLTRQAAIAFLVLTAEDESEDGMRARQNVVHELGLFQGKLGFDRGIALVEEGTRLFSNLEGIQQIRFSQGKIRETFGDVVATIRREFAGG